MHRISKYLFFHLCFKFKTKLQCAKTSNTSLKYHKFPSKFCVLFGFNDYKIVPVQTRQLYLSDYVTNFLRLLVQTRASQVRSFASASAVQLLIWGEWLQSGVGLQLVSFIFLTAVTLSSPQFRSWTARSNFKYYDFVKTTATLFHCFILTWLSRSCACLATDKWFDICLYCVLFSHYVAFLIVV